VAPGRIRSVAEAEPGERLHDRLRLDALIRTGLDAVADPVFDRFAAMVRDVLEVPVALVSLVSDTRQIFPGACGLADPWQQQRQTPLSHSFCQHVVTTGQPLVITDARTDPRVAGNLAVSELGVVGYAGMPLTDADGHVLGSLCAIDTEPRRWTGRELHLLADLAAACSDSLRLRIATGQAEQDARTEQRRAGAAFDRSQLLLQASSALAGTSTVDDIIGEVRRLAAETLDAAYAGISLLDADGALVLSTGSALPAPVAQRWARFHGTMRTPSALAIARGGIVLLPDPVAIARDAPDAAATFGEMGWKSAAGVPLPGPAGPTGALTFVWSRDRQLDESEQTVLAALAGYVAQALRRAATLDDRRTAAATLQLALLSPIPRHDHLRIAAGYRPAHEADHVGGDWYDAISIDRNRLAVVIGDVTGHSVQAAAAMSQLRSMLRALLVDRQESPAAVLRRLEHTSRVLGSTQLASVVLAHLDTTATGGHTLTWSNAGHPPPILRQPAGSTELLEDRDPLLGAVRHASRRNHTISLPPGSALLFYTDGLVETRHSLIDTGITRTRDLLSAAAGKPVDEVVDLLCALPEKHYEDDLAVLLLEIPAAPPR
jgi:serine phosphatase RsbU (regulator of sigma subunit)